MIVSRIPSASSQGRACGTPVKASGVVDPPLLVPPLDDDVSLVLLESEPPLPAEPDTGKVVVVLELVDDVVVVEVGEEVDVVVDEVVVDVVDVVVVVPVDDTLVNSIVTV